MNDLQAIVFLAGILICYVLVKILKNIIKEFRPGLSKTYGMPSSRSTVTAFILCFLLQNFEFSKKTKLLLIIFSFFDIFLKLYLQEHTPLQLICGVILGSFLAYISNIYKTFI